MVSNHNDLADRERAGADRSAVKGMGMTILQQLREWNQQFKYPLVPQAIAEIEALQARNGELREQINKLQEDIAAKWQVIWALRNGMDDLTQRITRLERALVLGDQQNNLSQPSENIAGPKINWVP